MRKTAKVLLLSLLTIGMTVGCAGRTPKSSAPAPSSDAPISQPDSSNYATSNPVSSSTPAPDTSSAAPSSAQSNSSAAPSSSSEKPSSSIAPSLTGISLNTDSVDKDYLVGENLNLTGLVVTANYSDGNSNVVTNYTTNPADGALLSTAGTINVVVTYESASASFSVVVNNPPKSLTGISLNTDNVKVDYFVGENLDLSGLVVNANFDDGSSEVVTNYTSNPADGTTLTEIGDAFVTITYENYDEDFMISVSSFEKLDWTDEEAALMAAHLYGDVLPYNGLEESIVNYDDDNDMIVIEGGAINSDGLSAYAAALQNDGWYCYSSSSFAYAFEKDEENELGEPRRLDIYLSTNDSDEFYLEAYDPYYSEFPSEFAEYYADSCFDSDEVAPAIDAWFYDVNERYLYIVCYGEYADDTGGYDAILEGAGWDILDIRDSYDYYIAVSPDGKYEVSFLAFPSDNELYIYIEPLCFWNEDLIIDFFFNYGFDGFDVPPLEVDGAQYQFLENSNNESYFENDLLGSITASMFIYGVDEDNFDDYLDAIHILGWEISTLGTDSYYATLLVEGGGVAKMNISFEDECVTITIYGMLGEEDTNNWPADEVAAFLLTNGNVTDVLPPFPNTVSVSYVTTYSYGDAAIHVTCSNPASDAATYEQLLDGQGWEIVGQAWSQNVFQSPNHQMTVSCYVQTSRVTLEIYWLEQPTSEWPADRIAEELGDDITDVVPEYEGDNDGFLWLDDEYGVGVQVLFDDTVDEEEALEYYIDVLKDAKYVEYGPDAYGDMQYISENEQIIVCPYIGTENSITISFKPYLHFPVEEATAALLDLDDTIEDEIPGIDGLESYYVYKGDDYVQVQCIAASEDAVYDAFDEYLDILDEAGFITDGPNAFGNPGYNSPNGEFYIVPRVYYYSYYDTYYLLIEIYPGEFEPAEFGWPYDLIVDYLGDEDLADLIPEPDFASELRFDAVASNYADFRIVAYTGDSDITTGYIDEYVDLLVDAGWVENGVDEYDDMHYTDPDNLLDVCPTAGYDSGKLFAIEVSIVPEPIEWPAEEVAAFLLANGNVTDVLPPFPSLTKNIEYSTNYSYGDAAIYCYCDNPSGARDVYEAALEEAGWELTGTAYGQNVYTSPNGQMTVSCYVQSSRVTLEIYWLEPEPPVAEWPGDAISSLMGDFGYENNLPAAECDFTSVDVDSNSDFIMIFVNMEGDADAIDDAMSEYCAVLEGEGFDYLGADEYGDYYFLSPDGDYQVDIYLEDDGFGINVGWFMELPEDSKWPVELQEIFEDYGFSDALPEYAEEYVSANVSIEDDGSICVEVVIDGDDSDFAMAVLSYADILDTEGFEFVGSDGEDNLYYVSPNGEYELEVSISAVGFLITITPCGDEPFENEFDSFPMDLIVEFYPSADEVLPSIDDASMFYVDPGSDQDYFIMDVYYEEGVDGAESRANFIDALVEAGFTYQEVEEGTYGYVSPDGDFVVIVYAYSSDEGYFTIDIASMGIYAVE